MKKVELVLKAKEVYGVRKYYPANREAELFLKLSNTKTISKYWFPVIRELGFDVVVKEQETL